MRFERSLHRLLDFIVGAEPQLCPGFQSKVDLADAYMNIWVRLNIIKSIAFLITKEKKYE